MFAGWLIALFVSNPHWNENLWHRCWHWLVVKVAVSLRRDESLQSACGSGNSRSILSATLSTLCRFGSLFWRHNVHRKRLISAERDGYCSRHKFDRQTVPAAEPQHRWLIGKGRRQGRKRVPVVSSYRGLERGTQLKSPAPFFGFCRVSS